MAIKVFAFGLPVCWLRFSSSSSSSSSPSPLMPSSLELHPAVAFVDCFVVIQQLTTKRTMQSSSIEKSSAKNNLNIIQTGPSGSDDERSDPNYSKDITDNKNDQPSWLSSSLDRENSLEMRLDATLVSIYVLARFLVYDIASGAKDNPGLDIQDWVRILSAISSAIILSGCWSLCGLVMTRSFQTQQEKENEQDEGKTIIPIDDNLRTVILTLVNTSLSMPIWFLLERAFNFGPPGFDLRDCSSIEVVLSTGLGLAATMIVAKTATNGWK